MTFGQIYGLVKKGRWFGRSSNPKTRHCMVADTFLIHDMSEDGTIIKWNVLSLTTEDIMADDWEVYS
jgi:hypothetical protein